MLFLFFIFYLLSILSTINSWSFFFLFLYLIYFVLHLIFQCLFVFFCFVFFLSSSLFPIPDNLLSMPVSTLALFFVYSIRGTLLTIVLLSTIGTVPAPIHDTIHFLRLALFIPDSYYTWHSGSFHSFQAVHALLN